jgi:RimJ/RimL family protein N-acetyltransferase
MAVAKGELRSLVAKRAGKNIGMHRQVVLTTERLQVTTWLPEDVDDLHRLHSDPVTMRWVRNRRPETRAEVETLVASYRTEERDRGWTKWRIADRDNMLLGRAGFGTCDGGDGRELGYTLRRDHWGYGVATEIAAGLVDWHRRNSDAQLWAFAAAENAANRRVLEKVGFDLVGNTKHNGMPCALYRLDSRPGFVATGDRSVIRMAGRQPAIPHEFG